MDQRTNRHRYQQIHTLTPCALLPHAWLTIFSLINPLIAKINQRIQTLIRHQINRAAIAAIAPIRATIRDILFTAKTQAARTTLARLDTNSSFIKKLHGSTLTTDLAK